MQKVYIKKIFFLLFILFDISIAQNGIIKSYYPDGVLRSEVSFVNDILDGPAIYFYPNGNLKSEKNYSNGILEGMVKEFYENGLLKEEFSVKEGIKNGSYRAFYENGALKKIIIYESGILVNETNFDFDNSFKAPVELFNAGNRQQQIQKKKSQDFICDVEICPVPIGGMNAIQDKLIYPEHALLYGLEGTVSLIASINEKGEVINLETIKTIGLGCEEAAKEAVIKTLFIPGRNGDNVVTSRVTLHIEFRIFNGTTQVKETNPNRGNDYTDRSINKNTQKERIVIKCDLEECPYPVDDTSVIFENVEIPAVAKRLKIKGEIILEAEIDIYGIVKETKVIKKIGYGCDEAVESAIMKTKFNPAKSKGNPINSKVIIFFPFDAN